METKLKLETRARSGKETARKLRRAGRVPGVIYGGGDTPVLVSMETREVLNLFQSISVDNTILDLHVDDGSAERGLVREIQVHPYRSELLHVDFIRVRRGVPIEVQVPLRFTGIADGVRNSGGVLDQVVHSLPVKCIPSMIPEGIDVDVTALAVGDVIRAGDIEMPDGVESLADAGKTICGVAAPSVSQELVDEEEEVSPGEAFPTGEFG